MSVIRDGSSILSEQSFGVVLGNDFLGHHILPSLHQSSKGRDDIGWNRYHRKQNKYKGRVLPYVENTLVLQSVKERGGSALDKVVEEVCSNGGDRVPGVERVEVLLGDQEGTVVFELEEPVILVGHGQQAPWNEGRHCVVLHHLGSSNESFPAPWLLYQHVYVVGNVRYSSRVSLSLPETGLHVC